MATGGCSAACEAGVASVAGDDRRATVVCVSGRVVSPARVSERRGGAISAAGVPAINRVVVFAGSAGAAVTAGGIDELGFAAGAGMVAGAEAAGAEVPGAETVCERAAALRE
ncbi:MAG TPA: hypothetical protein VG713_06805, partial [Pirellulales bacterium]|nr:hypothetical protein [Pirellulales bacterium]